MNLAARIADIPQMGRLRSEPGEEMISMSVRGI